MSRHDEKLSASPPFRLGIDLGGTKTEVAVLDDKLQTVYRKRVTTPADDYEAILTIIANLVSDAEKSLPVSPPPVPVPSITPNTTEYDFPAPVNASDKVKQLASF